MRKRGLFICIMFSLFSVAWGQRWEHYNSDNSDLPEGKVNAVFVDAYGGKWFGTNQGLVYFSGTVWRTYTEEEGLASQKINALTGEKVAENRSLYVSTNQGVSLVDYDAGGLNGITSFNSENSGLQSDSIASIVLDTGLIYYGSRLGLDIQSGDRWTFLDQVSTMDGDVSLQQIRSMALTPDGWNFVGTSEAGVARLHYEVDGVTGASSYSTEWSGLLSDQINDIHINAEGNQWYATGKGVAHHVGYETKENWETYTESSSGLLSNLVHAVAVDGNGTTWAGTDKGISKFDGLNWASYPYIDEISDYSVFDVDFDLDGTIWFACDIGVLHLDELGFPAGTNPEEKRKHPALLVYPSVASDVVQIQTSLPDPGRLSIFVLGLDGKVVCRLVDGWKGSGSFTFTWNLNDPASQSLEGSYMIVAKTGREYLSRKIIIVR